MQPSSWKSDAPGRGGCTEWQREQKKTESSPTSLRQPQHRSDASTPGSPTWLAPHRRLTGLGHGLGLADEETGEVVMHEAKTMTEEGG